MSDTGAEIRPRTPADLPELVDALQAQQPASRYPFRWPLPFPVEQFLVRQNEEAGWVAVVDGRVVGHVSIGRVEGERVDPFVSATGRPVTDLAIVSVLFVAPDAQGSGIGGSLLDTAVAWARTRGRLPVLDVVQSHGTAVEVYRHRGWQVVGDLRPAWLPDSDEPLLLMQLGHEGRRPSRGSSRMVESRRPPSARSSDESRSRPQARSATWGAKQRR